MRPTALPSGESSIFPRHPIGPERRLWIPRARPTHGPGAGIGEARKDRPLYRIPCRRASTLVCLAAQAGPSPFRRTFNATFRILPKASADSICIRHLNAAPKEGDGVAEASFRVGFRSMSRVHGETAPAMDRSRTVCRAGGAAETIAYVWRDTALGPMMMAASERGVCLVQFGRDPASLLEQLQAKFPKADLVAPAAQEAPELDAWIEALDAHIGRGAPRPELALDLRGTVFQMKVWRFLLRLREGEAISYGELAARIGRSKAIRAVAGACAANRIGILVPCHRVLCANGHLGGYQWGLERKQALLDAERSRKVSSPVPAGTRSRRARPKKGRSTHRSVQTPTASGRRYA